MKTMFVKLSFIVMSAGMFLLCTSCTQQEKSLELTSNSGKNGIYISLDEGGSLFYDVKRDGAVMISKSPLGLKTESADFTKGLSVIQVSEVEEKRENYELVVANTKKIDEVLEHRSITFQNESGDSLILDLVAGEQGVAFRYRLPGNAADLQVVTQEITGFQIDENAEGWLQPYNKAGDYTPAYEDFYFKVNPGDPISNPRNPSVGWCMPTLFNVNQGGSWILIAESATDGSYPGCHLLPNSDGGMYKIAFAKNDEKYTLPIPDKDEVFPTSKLPWTMPWRVIMIGDQAGDILLNTMITDLAPASKIEDTSWISVGKASWSWWSHPGDHSPEIYNEFTDLASSMDWEYTLFDAGWEDANKKGGIIDYAISKGIKPMVWGYSGSYFKPEERKERFENLAAMGIRGVKIDFWCSDRQEVMGELQTLFSDAADQKLLINLHGSTMPRGWHRTWPNFVTAESVLGTESYFYEKRFPALAAEQNTVLPFTRNVAGPTDYTPIALTIREFPRLNSAAHELATPMIYTSGVIHFADSKEVFDGLPEEVKSLLKEMPATWDETQYIVADPGEGIVLYRKHGDRSYIVGINGAAKISPITIDLKKYSGNHSSYTLINEGEDPLMEFSVETHDVSSNWSYDMASRGGFILEFTN